MAAPAAWAVPIAIALSACGGAPAAVAPAPQLDGPAAQLERAKKQIAARAFGDAQRLIDQARIKAGTDWASLNQVSYVQATLFSYRGDFARAADTLLARFEPIAARTDDPEEFYLHNHLIMLRAVQGDWAGAIVECDAMTRAGERGTFIVPERDRMTQVRLKDYWHRAYLLRAWAATLTSGRTVALAYAERARADYRDLATRVGGFTDSIAVLDAFFAVHAGDRAAALAAARRVDLAGDDDVEDLYFVYMAFAFGGDQPAADDVARRMASVGYVSHANAVYLTYVERDRKGAAPTPLHPH